MAPAAALLLLSTTTVWSLAAAERKLVFVTVLFRHGDRSPIQAYPTDPYQESSWPQGFGQLSQEGMRQQFELGQFLRTRYKDFLNESYDRHEVWVRSSDYDRTLMSAQANLAGLYPPSGHQVFNPDLNWQPIPVHTVPQDQDRLLIFPQKDCPRYSQLMNETKHTEEVQNITAEYQDFIEFVSNKSGQNNTSVENVLTVQDALFCESCHNMTPPDWVTPDVEQKLCVLKDFSYDVMFGVHKQVEKSRLQGGMLLAEIIKDLSQMASWDPKQRLKLKMLSAHDTTLVALQSSLNVYGGKQPPYASCHMVELYREDDGSPSVAMLFRNDSGVPPYPLQLPGCGFYCPLDRFLNLTAPSISSDRDRECQLLAEGAESGSQEEDQQTSRPGGQ
ncbi:lysosomal acid phosphatase-like [Salarias fasciatus]|uniref:Lysosomal acid phosphatase n=1 Tax=Salarias fasciatus TaxID=181472 RepID=A0A672FU47_SALFA|nr:lysosomal acid phosphatase-like [Salarias fasciatus]